LASATERSLDGSARYRDAASVGSLQEIAGEPYHLCGVRVCDATIRRALRTQGSVRLKSVRQAYAAAASKGGKRYGYTAAHRRKDVSPDSTNLTDAEWELVADLFERSPGQRGKPVTAASVQDRDAAAAVVAQACTKIPRLEKLYTDGAYGGKCGHDIEQAHHIRVEVVRRPGNGTIGTLHDPTTMPEQASVVNAGFVILPKRWVVERTHVWTERWRRTIMHHDRKLDVSAAWVWLAEARMLLNRLAYQVLFCLHLVSHLQRHLGTARSTSNQRRRLIILTKVRISGVESSASPPSA
jgi:transposase